MQKDITIKYDKAVVIQQKKKKKKKKRYDKAEIKHIYCKEDKLNTAQRLNLKGMISMHMVPIFTLAANPACSRLVLRVCFTWYETIKHLNLTATTGQVYSMNTESQSNALGHINKFPIVITTMFTP